MKRKRSTESPAAASDAVVQYCLVDSKLWRAKTSHSIDLRPFWFNTHSPKSEETLASLCLQQLCNRVDVEIWRAAWPQSQEKTLHQWPWCIWWHKSEEKLEWGSDRCATQAGPLIAGSGWTPRRTFGLIKPSASHIPACVPQQPLAPPRLQTAALPEGQDFCLCWKKQIFTPNPHTPVRLENEGQ